MQFKVFFGNENTFPLSSAIYSRILDIEGLLTRNQTTLFISTGIPFLAELFRGMLFKWKGENKKSHQK